VKRLQPVGTGPLQGGPTKTRYEPVLLLDPEMDRVGKLAAQLATGEAIAHLHYFSGGGHAVREADRTGISWWRKAGYCALVA
jgi:hypothetical protein